MTVLSRAQLYQYGAAAGFKGAALDEVVAIALAESGGDTQHVNVNPASTTKIGGKTTAVPAGTKDQGILQINTWWNPSVTSACTFDPTCSFAWAFKVTGGRQPTSGSDPFLPFWVTVQNGAYKSHLTPGAGGQVGSSTGTTLSSGSNLAGLGSAAVGNIVQQVIDLSPITNWLSSLQPLWNWLGNPIRLVKLLAGIGMIAGAILLLVTPEGQILDQAGATLKVVE